jgi:hypothetical protein
VNCRYDFCVAKEKLARDCSRTSSLILTLLYQLSTCGSNDGGDGVYDSKLDARYTSSMKGRYSSTSGMDSTLSNRCSSCMGNTRHNTSDNRNSIRKTDILRSRLPQLLEFRRKLERQNAARARKPIHLPPVQLKEAFS